MTTYGFAFSRDVRRTLGSAPAPCPVNPHPPGTPAWSAFESLRIACQNERHAGAIAASVKAAVAEGKKAGFRGDDLNEYVRQRAPLIRVGAGGTNWTPIVIAAAALGLVAWVATRKRRRR